MNCPICKQEFDPETSSAMPFCSERCRTIDLGRWLDEHYSLPESLDGVDELAEHPGEIDEAADDRGVAI